MTGCDNQACRDRHWKCNTDRTPCPNCESQGVECVRRGRIRFSHAMNPSFGAAGSRPTDRGNPGGSINRRHKFSKSQRWVKTDRALSFVDETKDVANLDEYIVAGHHGHEDTAIDSPISAESSSQAPSPSPGFPPGYASSSSASAHSCSVEKPLLVSQDVSEPGNRVSTEEKPSDTDSVVADSLIIQPTSTLIDQGLEVHPAPPSEICNPTLSGRPNLAVIGGQQDFNIDITDGPSPSLEDFVPLLSPQDLALVDGEAGTIYLDAPRWPLQDPEEAFLFRYYIDNLTPMLDMCDDEKHFARIVPLRAATCCPLFHAILAYAARRLSRLGDHEKALVADKHHQKCLNALIPALSHSAAVSDENLLTSLVVLRLMEELDVPMSSPSPEFHLMGTRVFLEAQKKSCDFTGLRLAAFWVALRQEIYMAFIHARPVHADFALNNFDWLIKLDETGCSVANRIVIYCAACLRYCYGPQESTVAEWDELQGHLQQWWDERPWFYIPIYSNRSDNGELASFLPKEPYCNSAVVTGVQHYHLAKMLLTAHNPKIPKLGPGRRVAFNSMNDAIKETVRTIVGIAESNQHTLPAYVTASMAITMAGDRFTEWNEQEILYEVLMKIDRDLAWPTHSARQALRESWGWGNDPSLNRPGMPIDGMLNDDMRASCVC